MSKQLILGSSSIYRRTLLERLRIPFEWVSPEIDETRLDNESINEFVQRLAYEKALAVSRQLPSSQKEVVIIGSDQAATFEGQILGKPRNFKNAFKQLSSFSGNTVTFMTALCVLDNHTKTFDLNISENKVTFRKLREEEITNYLTIEKPFDCAGSFKCEGFGIALFEKITGDDPNALIGLPLIKLCTALRKVGLNPLNTQSL
ncbi:septum formation inhibitor Maf [Marinomonas agarivorans]|nr:septum formation inhibitor Maf [Marinomonas agarivorans]